MAATDASDGRPQNLAALKIKAIALDRLLVANGEINFSDTMWFESGCAAVEAALK